MLKQSNFERNAKKMLGFEHFSLQIRDIEKNCLLSTFKRLLRNYYLEALYSCYDAEDPKTWKSVCLNCNSCRSLNSVINYCF